MIRHSDKKTLPMKLPTFATPEGEEYSLQLGRVGTSELKAIQGCSCLLLCSCSNPDCSFIQPLSNETPATSGGKRTCRRCLHRPCPVHCHTNSDHNGPDQIRPVILGTWNMSGIANASRELDVTLVATGVDVLFLSETELPPDCCVIIPGFVTFYPVSPSVSAKTASPGKL